LEGFINRKIAIGAKEGRQPFLASYEVKDRDSPSFLRYELNKDIRLVLKAYRNSMFVVLGISARYGLWFV
jgi:hypothetical protein